MLTLGKRRAAVAPPAPPDPPPGTRAFAAMGQMMYVHDIVKLFGTREDGRPAKSEWWVRTQFLQDKKRRIGKTPFWWEAHVMEAIEGGNVG